MGVDWTNEQTKERNTGRRRKENKSTKTIRRE